jgi:hypothetical protein
MSFLAQAGFSFGSAFFGRTETARKVKVRKSTKYNLDSILNPKPSLTLVPGSY